MSLSPEQKRAVEREGQDVCVVAGPGSGKTRVLTERFAWLVEHHDIDPGRILAVTFTEKAAIEIKQRLIKRFADHPTRREAVERAWVSTIHGFCTRLLQDHAIAAGLSPDFVVLDQPRSDRLQREAAETALDALFRERPAEMRRLLEAVDLSTSDGDRSEDLAASLLGIYEAMRVSGVHEIPPSPPAADVWPEAHDAARVLLGTSEGEWAAKFLALDPARVTLRHFELLAQFEPSLKSGPLRKIPQVKLLRDDIKPRLESQWLGEWFGDLHGLLRAAIARLDVEYRKLKRRESAVDFSDLEEFTVRLLESNAGVLFETRSRFDEVLMDELQDTNRVQWKLIELVKSRLYAVGDINQSIYGFRHADPEVFAEYRDGLLEAGWQIDELQDNYRSRPEILDAVARTLDGAPGIEPRTLHSRGKFETAEGPLVERFVATGDGSVEVEAALVAARIRDWHNSGTFAYKDVAVLVRTLRTADAFVEAFDRADIPFLVSGGRGFLEARETRDVLLFLAALVNTCDEVPLLGVLRGPMVGLSDEDLYAMGREGWRREFEKRFGEIRQLAGFVAPDRLIAQALDACGYAASLPERAQANLDKLLAWIRREFRRQPRSLAQLLEDLEALRDAQSVADAPPPEAGDVVRIMTIHAAKGLEFPAVFVVGLHRGTENRSPALLFSRHDGLGVKWRNPVTHDGSSDPVHAQLKAREKSREEAEASRLLYVAMTRAQQRLILTHAERPRKSAWEKRAIEALPQALIADAPPALTADHVEQQGLDAVALAAAPAAGLHDAAASVTSISTFAACPRRYYLERYLGLQAPLEMTSGAKSEEGLEPEADSGVNRAGRESSIRGMHALTLGSAVHAILAGQISSEVDFPAARALAGHFHRSDWGGRAAQASRSEHEFDLMFEIDGMILSGQIDLWFEDAGELIMVDYKTDRDEASAPAYALQLQLYALGLQTFTKRRPDYALLFYLRSGHAISVDLSEAALHQARAQVAALREAQANSSFPLHPGAQCHKCPFLAGLCPEGRKEGSDQEGKVRNQLFGPPSSFLMLASGGS